MTQSFIEKFDLEVDENKAQLLSSSVEITRDQTPIGEFHLTTSTSDFRPRQKLDFLFHVLKYYQKRQVLWHIKEIDKYIYVNKIGPGDECIHILV